MATPISILTVVALFHGGRVLLLRRAAWKTFAPNRWTGIGGKIEPGELGNVAAAAERELFEETDLTPAEVTPLRLRRTLTFDRPGEGLVCLIYFTGHVAIDRVPSCNEGTLAWIAPGELGRLDVLENTAQVLPLLIKDEENGAQRVRCGTASYDEQGNLLRVSFDPAG